MKARLSFWGKIITTAFLALCVFFAGCDTPTNGNPPRRFGPNVAGAEFNGSWKSEGSYGTDQFKIDTATSPKTFTYWFNSATGPGLVGAPDYTGTSSMDYQGNIVGEIESNPGLLKCEWGYITLEITSAGPYGPAVGKYYVIHWKNLTTSSVKEAGAYRNGSSYNSGMDTPAAAVAEYTAEKGYFGMTGTYSPVP
ncbi:MAG: hypothetical protein LBP29_07755 [Treponema sp.]|jgi:hypothetical protein|nr:hypothetical protein [Treponema sp.]